MPASRFSRPPSESGSFSRPRQWVSTFRYSSRVVAAPPVRTSVSALRGTPSSFAIRATRTSISGGKSFKSALMPSDCWVQWLMTACWPPS